MPISLSNSKSKFPSSKNKVNKKKGSQSASNDRDNSYKFIYKSSYIALFVILFFLGSYILFIIRYTNHFPVFVNNDKLNLRKDTNISTKVVVNDNNVELSNKNQDTNIDQLISKRCPNRVIPEPQPLPPNVKEEGATDFHFIHMPKCGGTSMTAVLRQIACAMDPKRNEDCCTNPGFCDWHAHRRCNSIKGCINHFPQRKWIFKKPPSIVMFREPISRILSAWFYRGHSPNLDFFQVRPEFKEIEKGLRPRVVFEEYIEMPEYQNIQTRMLGNDSFPYRNITINEDMFCSAVEALDNIYFVGLLEAYDISVDILIREFGVDIKPSDIKERDQSSGKIKEEKDAIKKNDQLMARLKEFNHYDRDLYSLAVLKFCQFVKKYPDLYEKVLSTTKVKCS